MKKFLIGFGVVGALFLTGCEWEMKNYDEKVEIDKSGEILITFPAINFGKTFYLSESRALEAEAICTEDINYLEIEIESLSTEKRNVLGMPTTKNCNFTLLPEMWSDYGDEVRVILRGIHEAEDSEMKENIFEDSFLLNFDEAVAGEISDSAEGDLTDSLTADAAEKLVEKLEAEVISTESGTTFEVCGASLSDFTNYVWYYTFLDRMIEKKRYHAVEKATYPETKISSGSIDTVCYSQNGKLFLAIVPARGDGKGFQLLRFQTKARELDLADRDDIFRTNVPLEAGSEAPELWPTTPATFGKRTGDVIRLFSRNGYDASCPGHASFSYNFVKNRIKLDQACTTSYQ